MERYPERLTPTVLDHPKGPVIHSVIQASLALFSVLPSSPLHTYRHCHQTSLIRYAHYSTCISLLLA